MNIFRKDPPACCPKCGEKDGWHQLPAETEEYTDPGALAGNPFSAAPIRGTFAQNLTSPDPARRQAEKRRKVRYACSKCGYLKSY